MRVLIACEESGIIREAFKARGHNAWSCDLGPSRIAGQHIQGDVRSLGIDFASFDILLAHPPCKFIAGSGMHWTTRGLRDPRETAKAIEFAEWIWELPVGRICVENPVGALSTKSKLGKASQWIQPYDFGHDASKKTGLWLKGLPLLLPTKYIEPRITKDGKRRWANQTDSGQNRLGPSEERSAIRATTYQGIAQAMTEQWG